MKTISSQIAGAINKYKLRISVLILILLHLNALKKYTRYVTYTGINVMKNTKEHVKN